MNADSPSSEPSGSSSSFPTTHWSVVVNACSIEPPAARAALETLCRQYWYPIYAFVRRQGRDHHEAEDLVQSFFAQLLESERIGSARPERGRFRTFLLAALTNFLTDEWRRRHAQKRGAGETPIAFDVADAEKRFAAEPVDGAMTPEQAFDRAWALSVVERALAELRGEYEADGRGAVFAAVAAHVWGDGPATAQAEAARQLGMQEHAFTVAVARLRQRLRDRLRAHVTATVARETDAASELHHLLAAVRGGK